MYINIYVYIYIYMHLPKKTKQKNICFTTLRTKPRTTSISMIPMVMAMTFVIG